MKNLLTFKEQFLVDNNPNILRLIKRFECEPRITKEMQFNSKINARVEMWMNEIVNPINENKITKQK